VQVGVPAVWRYATHTVALLGQEVDEVLRAGNPTGEAHAHAHDGDRDGFVASRRHREGCRWVDAMRFWIQGVWSHGFRGRRSEVGTISFRNITDSVLRLCFVKHGFYAKIATPTLHTPDTRICSDQTSLAVECLRQTSSYPEQG